GAWAAGDRYGRVAEGVGAVPGPKVFHVPVREKDRQWVQAHFQDCPRPWVALGVGARWMTKRWPAEHFATLAQKAHSHFAGTFLFVGGREETALARATATRLRGPKRDLTGTTTLPQLAAVLEAVDVLVANDTGPLHLAAALGRPVVAPYTCTRVRGNGPYGAEAGAVETKVWCAGSYLKR